MPDKMHEKSLTVVSYAVGASLAAAALIYVFAPTHLLESSPSSSSRGGGVTGVAGRGGGAGGPVGLRNYANDCFINSVLQALAGLGELRVYLIREVHRRVIDHDTYYGRLAPAGQTPAVAVAAAANTPDWKLRTLQEGTVTAGLKTMLDALNERPIARKSIEATPFIQVLQTAFRQQISRQQQDAQEFLQIVAERLKEEYAAGERARRIAGADHGDGAEDDKAPPRVWIRSAASASAGTDDGFPMEGRYECQVECQTCGYRTKPREESFYMLTLNVPWASSTTTLEACLDGLFKSEIIDDFRCDRCRLVHARQALAAATAAPDREALARLDRAISDDPETPPSGVELPDPGLAPRRRISRTTRMSRFPRILVVHLSRSMYSAGGASGQKNSAKVIFPERLPMGSLVDARSYRLLTMVTHRGSHNSGHYESFRRQATTAPPYSNLNTFRPSGVYSRAASPSPGSGGGGGGGMNHHDYNNNNSSSSDSNSNSNNDRMNNNHDGAENRLGRDAPSESAQASSSPATLNAPSTPHRPPLTDPMARENSRSPPPTATAAPRETDSLSPRSRISRKSRKKAAAAAAAARDRWWRISDEKVKEARTSEVLDMQREVYLLFYELDRDRGG